MLQKDFRNYAGRWGTHWEAIVLIYYVVVDEVILFVMMMYQFRSSCCVRESSRLFVMMSVRIFLVPVTGIFKYMLVMSRDANVKWGSIGMPFRLCIKSLVFFMLKEYGKGVSWLIFCVNNLAHS